LQIFGGATLGKRADPGKRIEPSEITCKQSEPARTISKIEKRREFVRALCYEQCPKNSFKRLYIVKGLLVLVEKLRFPKNFDKNFNAVERVRVALCMERVRVALCVYDIGIESQKRLVCFNF